MSIIKIFSCPINFMKIILKLPTANAMAMISATIIIAFINTYY